MNEQTNAHKFYLDTQMGNNNAISFVSYTHTDP